MPNIAIKVENLSKRYRIGLKEELHDTLVAAMTDWIKRPVHNFRRLRALSRFDDRRPETEDGILSPVSRPPSVEDDIIWALKDVSFEVQRGEVVGIIGRNGAGKSTLLKILSRITYPTSGRVELHGRVSSLLEVGTGFHPELTGRENIYLNGTILGMTKAEIDRKFAEIVDFSGVEKFIDTPVKRYSSGMGVRLAFSVAAHLEPEILLVDEVLAVGDAEFQKKCLGKMGEVASEGRTVLFVSHNMGAIQALCKKVIVLDSGSLFYRGEVGNAINQYLLLSDSFDDVKLGERKDRSGNGIARIVDAFMLDASGSKKCRFAPGDRATLVLKVETNNELLRGISFMATIYDQTGYALTHFSNEFTGDIIELIKGRNEVQCSISGFPFRPGFYSINLALRKGPDFLDHIQKAVKIELVDNNYFGTGKMLSSNVAPLLIKHAWQGTRNISKEI